MFKASDLELPTGQRIALEIKAGEIHCLRGDSGVGKSRLLRALADIDDRPGHISLTGKNRCDMPATDWRREVMLVPARPRWWHATAGEHMARNMQTEAQALRLSDAQLNSPADRLSSGEGSRLALLRALSYGPRVLLLDEPTAALDEEAEAATETLLKDYISDKERCILWITHSQTQAERIGDKQWYLSKTALEQTA